MSSLLTFAESYPSLASWLLFMLTFHPACLIFHFLDCKQHFASYKIYPPTENTPSYRQMLPIVLFNQIFILLPSMLLTTYLNLSYAPKHLQPSPLQSIIAIILFTTSLHELAFYVVHRYILHSAWGFHRLNHALHHATKAHSAISAMYMSPPDFFLEIVIPYLVPLIFVSHFNCVSNIFCTTIFPLGAFGGLYEHSGYNFFPNIPALDTTVHGLHHIYYHCSFADGVGSPSVLDRLFETVCAHVGPAAPAARTFVSWFIRDPYPSRNQSQPSMPVDYIRSVQERFAKLWNPWHKALSTSKTWAVPDHISFAVLVILSRDGSCFTLNLLSRMHTHPNVGQ